MKLYKKQIRPIAQGGAWQGFNPESTPLSDWIDIEDSEEQIENQLKEKWTGEEMFKIGLAEIHYVFSIVNECEYK